MKAEDVTATLDLALEASGCDCATVVAKPRLLSDNGSSYIAGDLADYLDDKGMDHVRGAPYHPQTQGKIERWHQTMNRRSAKRITVSCSSITSCPVISSARLTPSSNTTTTNATTRALET
jgi:Integrase core domain.